MNDIKEKKQVKTLRYKLPMFLLVIGYMIYFIYEIFTKDFSLDYDNDKIKLILLFIIVFIMGCSAILAIFFSITNIILVVVALLINFNVKIPNFKTSDTKKSGNIICTGKTDTSDNTTVEIEYDNDTINKIVYKYIFNLDNKTGAENLVNHFDKNYSEINAIYSEITYKDNVEVKFTYNIDKIDKDTLKSLDEITDSYKEFKEKELNKLQCKNRD